MNYSLFAKRVSVLWNNAISQKTVMFAIIKIKVERGNLDM